jgi:hypothetical protein
MHRVLIFKILRYPDHVLYIVLKKMTFWFVNYEIKTIPLQTIFLSKINAKIKLDLCRQFSS